MPMYTPPIRYETFKRTRRRPRWRAALLLLIILTGMFSAAWTIHKSRTFQFFGGLVHRVETSERVVALTFDDGPTNHAYLLPILDEYGAKATFFVVGREMERNLSLAQEMVDHGHELGNHSFSHARMVLRSVGWVRQEVERTDALIRAAGHEGEILFRPPYGKKLFSLPYYLSRTNRVTVMWDVEPESFPEVAGSSEEIVRHVMAHVQPGSIILLHGAWAESARAVAPLLSELIADGYRVVTVAELLSL